MRRSATVLQIKMMYAIVRRMKNVYIIFTIIVIALFGIFLMRDEVVHQMEEQEKPVIAASIFPYADIARHVGGDYVTVRTIAGNGVDVHDFEPAPSDINKIETSDIFIYNGYELEPWAEKLTEDLEREQVKYIEVATMLEGGDHASEEAALEEDTSETVAQVEEDEHGHSHSHSHSEDPHLWVKIDNMIHVAEAIRDELISAHPEYAEYYIENTEIYIALLEELDQQYRQGLAQCALREAVVSHDAFGYLGEEYDITFTSIAGLSPNDEPSLQELAEITLMMNNQGIRHIFVNPADGADLSETIARETGAEILVLNDASVITSEQAADGITYTRIMQGNLKNLQTGLQCNQ